MAKAGHTGSQFWCFVENLFQTELDKLKLPGQTQQQKASVLATICLALKDTQTHLFTDDFWKLLNSSLRQYASDRKKNKEIGFNDSEPVSVIKLAVSANHMLDDSLLNVLQ